MVGRTAYGAQGPGLLGAPKKRTLYNAPLQIDEFIPAGASIQKTAPTVPGARITPRGERVGAWMNEPLYHGGKMSRAEALYTLGAGLKDMGGGQGNLDAARGLFEHREDQARAERERQARTRAAAAALGAGGVDYPAYLRRLADAGVPVTWQDLAAADEQLSQSRRPAYAFDDALDGEIFGVDPHTGEAVIVYGRDATGDGMRPPRLSAPRRGG